MSNQMSPVQEFRGQLSSMAGEFTSALPSHIKPEQFQRVAVTAIQNDPNLLQADRKSLLGSIMKAAQDGLIPDGREGALVVFNTKDRNTQQWIQKVQWMPMIGGILKKIRQSGELASITAQVVKEGDEFDYWIDDDGEHLQHRPSFGDAGDVRLVYALAKTKDGAVYIEVMTKADIEKVRGASKTKDRGPWVDWWEQMAKKSAMHRLAKRLPISNELVTVVNRDEEFYDFDSARDITPRKQTQSLSSFIGEEDQSNDNEQSAAGMFGGEQ
ncbi:recombinase RecT [Alcanivorax jadensis]|uniref:recombinase RecT n=1 Tax=Alcanivorax jadensis TaxID=64988 RepID=UPI00235347F6|nr:recombinase RecT [Alcanivorax jadensis]